VKEYSVVLSRLFPLVCGVLVVSCCAAAQAIVPAEAILPATTKGFISTFDVNEVRTKFRQTQLGAMVNDELMKPFVEDLKQQIGAKLERAGKKLGIKWDDLEDVYSGEVAAALIQPDPKNKQSHATAVIVDTTGKRNELTALLQKIDANQQAHRARRSALREGNIEITVYTQPLKEGERSPETSFYFVSGDLLVLTDELTTIRGMIHRLDGQAKDSLATIKAFQVTMQQCAQAAGKERQQVRWFIEPFGYAEASRAAQGGKRRRGTDILKVLQSQGFTALQGVGGHVFFAAEGLEVLHRTFVYAPPTSQGADKYNLAMRMLDFPNSSQPGGLAPQSWVLPDVATYLSFNWKIKEAFKYSETLVDAIIGDKGTFKEIWDQLKFDPNGPQIDIYKGLMDHLGDRATLLSDVKLPVDTKSERLMGLIEVNDAKIVAETVEKAFKDDPQAKKHVFQGHVIWEIRQDEGLALDTELMIEGTGFVSTTEEAKPKAKDEDEEQKLPNMAVTVFLNHLIISTHVDFIEEFITHQGQPGNLASMEDYQRVEKALVALGSKQDSFNFFSRTDESYRATYELLKQGKLPEAETMLARLLNALMGPQEEGAVRKPEINGGKLPDFDQVKKYLGPGGLYIQTQDAGWWVVGCLLKK
jgi:hypothetical protein